MGIGALILAPETKERLLEYSKYIPAKEYQYATSNNVAEYLGVIEIFEYFIAKNLTQKNIICYGDSKLVINQMRGEWKCNGGIYSKYFYMAKTLLLNFRNIQFIWIPREQNFLCDELSKKGMIANGCEFRIQPIVK